MNIVDVPHSAASAVDLDACLDLINTVELTDGVGEDHLATLDDAIAFLVEHGRVNETALRHQARQEGEVWLARVHDLRAALRDVWDAQVAGQVPAAEALATVNRALAAAPRMELRATPAGVVVVHGEPGSDPTGQSLARIALPLAEAIAKGRTDRFRVCANDGCRWVFEDTSRGGRRHWCDMATCGNRAKVRRFRARRRDEPTGDADTPA